MVSAVRTKIQSKIFSMQSSNNATMIYSKHTTLTVTDTRRCKPSRQNLAYTYSVLHSGRFLNDSSLGSFTLHDMFVTAFRTNTLLPFSGQTKTVTCLILISQFRETPPPTCLNFEWLRYWFQSIQCPREESSVSLKLQATGCTETSQENIVHGCKYTRP